MGTLEITGMVIAIVVGLVLFFAVVLGRVLVALRRVARQKEASARARYPAAQLIDRMANFWGQESLSPGQPRGNGTLILTATELVFEMWVPERTFRVPLASIRAIENPRSFLGKTQGAPLLKVVYTNDQGATDALAWRVRDLEGWMAALGKT
jgi:hypothetical protein